MCYKTHLAIWSFKVASHNSLLVKKILTKRGPPLMDWTCSSLFLKFECVSDMGVSSLLAHPVSCNNQCMLKLRLTISKWSQKQWSQDFLKHLLELLERGSVLDRGSITPDYPNQTITFVFDFQVKRGLQSWFHCSWAQFRRIAILHIQHDFWGMMRVFSRTCSLIFNLFMYFAGMYFQVLGRSIRIKRQRGGNFSSKGQTGRRAP